MEHDRRASDGYRGRNEKCLSVDSTVAEGLAFQAEIVHKLKPYKDRREHRGRKPPSSIRASELDFDFARWIGYFHQ